MSDGKHIADIRRRIDQLIADRANDAALPVDQRAEIRRPRKANARMPRQTLIEQLRKFHPDLSDDEIRVVCSNLI